MHKNTFICNIIPLMKKHALTNCTHWVLFEHGTHILYIDDLPRNEKELKSWAIDALKYATTKVKTVHTFTDNLIKTTLPEGWIVPSILRGVYSFVDRNEFPQKYPSDVAVWVMGRNKQIKDANLPKILSTSYNSNFKEYH